MGVGLSIGVKVGVGIGKLEISGKELVERGGVGVMGICVWYESTNVFLSVKF